MQQFEIVWIEKNADGSETKETIKTGAVSYEEAKRQVYAIGNVIKIESITKLI